VAQQIDALAPPDKKFIVCETGTVATKTDKSAWYAGKTTTMHNDVLILRMYCIGTLSVVTHITELIECADMTYCTSVCVCASLLQMLGTTSSTNTKDSLKLHGSWETSR
jgi:hypothetical protein